MDDVISHTTEIIDLRLKQLKQLFKEIKQLDENELSHLYELIKLHNKCLFIVGDLEAECMYEKREAYRERKKVESETKLQTTGTGVIKEATAELAVQELRRIEHDMERMNIKYRNMYNAIEQDLIYFRQKRTQLEDELKYINDRQMT